MGKRETGDTYLITRVAQLRALESPARQEIVAALEELGPGTVGELAASLGRRAESLYYHVDKLVAAGLVRVKGTEATRTRRKRVYELVSRSVRSDPRQRSRAYLESLGRMYESVLRLAARRVHDAIADPRTRRDGPVRDLAVRQYNVRLDAKSLRELNRRLRDLSVFLRECQSCDGPRFYSVTVAMCSSRKDRNRGG